MRVGRDGGSALVLALAAASVVAAAVLLLAVMVEGRRAVVVFDERGAMLSELADAAIAETLAELAAEPAFAGVAERPLGGGAIRSTVGITPTGMLVVTGIGSAHGWRCVVVAEVAMDDGPRVVKMSRRHLPPEHR